jgi:hypothetical protein
MWSQESPAILAQYRQLAAELKAKHLEKYPNWKCSPRKSSQIKRRAQSKALQSAADNNADASTTSEPNDIAAMTGNDQDGVTLSPFMASLAGMHGGLDIPPPMTKEESDAWAETLDYLPSEMETSQNWDTLNDVDLSQFFEL